MGGNLTTSGDLYSFLGGRMGAAKVLCAMKYGCYQCPELLYCSYGKTLPYQNREGEIIMDVLTAQEVLRELESRFNMKLAKTEQKANNKLRDWVRRGIIEGPITRIGIGGSAGYSKDLPIQLATILFLKNTYRLTLDEIGKARDMAENNVRKNLTQKTIDNIINYFMGDIVQHIKLWLYYYAKFKAGMDINTPVHIQFNLSGSEYKETLPSKALEDSWTWVLVDSIGESHSYHFPVSYQKDMYDIIFNRE